MSTISVRLPESLHKKVKELTYKDGISINQFISSAVAEKMSVFLAEGYLEQRAQKGNRVRFLQVLRKVKKRPPRSK